MVKLPDASEQPAREVREVSVVRTPRSHHKWGSRPGGDKEAYRGEPTGLLQLEARARRTVELMEKYNPKSDDNNHKAMDSLRLQCNVNFVVLCEKCGCPRVTDEIIAPER